MEGWVGKGFCVPHSAGTATASQARIAEKEQRRLHGNCNGGRKDGRRQCVDVREGVSCASVCWGSLMGMQLASVSTEQQ